jgi:DNA-binding LacI/PurR family transcriptional regulator
VLLQLGRNQQFLFQGVRQGVPPKDRTRVTEVGRSEVEQLPALARWLAAPDRPEAVFCWSDLSAVPLLALASEQGSACPTTWR